MLINLVVNAIDAMEHLEKSQRRITLRTARDGDSAEIEIADSGPGILAGKFDDVFEPFYTTKPSGMGMGLSIARTIIEMMAAGFRRRTPEAMARSVPDYAAAGAIGRCFGRGILMPGDDWGRDLPATLT